jgi:hypothetical protein
MRAKRKLDAARNLLEAARLRVGACSNAPAPDVTGTCRVGFGSYEMPALPKAESDANHALWRSVIGGQPLPIASKQKPIQNSGAKYAAIGEAIAAIYAGSIPKSEVAKVRDCKIIDWVADNKRRAKNLPLSVSPRSIRKFIEKNPWVVPGRPPTTRV